MSAPGRPWKGGQGPAPASREASALFGARVSP